MPKSSTSYRKGGPPGNPDGKPATKLSDLPEGWRENALAAAADGASMAEITLIVGLKRTTFYEMIKREPAFSEVIEECKVAAEAWYEKAGRDLLTGRIQGNATTWIFSMRNKFGWRDKTEVEMSGPDGQPLQANPVRIELVAPSIKPRKD